MASCAQEWVRPLLAAPEAPDPGLARVYARLFPAYRQALRPGGLLFFETFVHQEAGDTPAYLLVPGELHQAFADFEIVHSLETAVRGPRSGKFRDIAQLIARKPRN